MMHNLFPRRGTTDPQDTETSENTQIFENEERTAPIHCVRDLLQELPSSSFRKNRPFPRTHQIGQASKDEPRTDHELRGHKQISR